MAFTWMHFLFALLIGFCCGDPFLNAPRIGAVTKQTRPIDLRTNNLVNPLGIGTVQPEFSWKLSVDPSATNVTQSAYEIQVYDSPQMNRSNLAWHTRKIISNQQFDVVYDGKTLKERHRYYWRLRIWDQANQISDQDWIHSENAWFETGILNPLSWKAKWISPEGTGGSSDESAIYLRGALNLTETPIRARAYSSALGWYKLFVNGHLITGSALVPRWTPYDHYVEYQTYDITPFLRIGENVVSMAVGDGRYRGWLGLTDGRNRYGDRLAAFAQLEVDFQDGYSETFVTDTTWTAHDGHVLRSDSRYGEHSDMRISNGGWLGTNSAKRKPVEIVKPNSQILIAEEVERVEEVMRLKPVSIRSSSSGHQIIDFGQNFAGSVRIKLYGPEGSKVTLTYSEVLAKNGDIDTDYLFPPFSLAPSQDTIILSADSSIVQPWFTIYGFRYVEVKGLSHTLTPEDIDGIVISSDLRQAGEFRSSDAKLNQWFSNIQWSTRSNYMDTATDCPTRERLGWTADIQVFAATGTLIVNSQNFLRRYLRNLALEQQEDGSVLPFAPSGASSFSGGVPGFTKKIAASAGWGDAAVVVPWVTYQSYGDHRVLIDQYQSMKHWVDFMDDKAQNDKSLNRFSRRIGDLERYIFDAGFQWGEWQRPGQTFIQSLIQQVSPSPAVATAYFAYSSNLLAQAAQVNGYERDYLRYFQLSQNISKAWRAAFVSRGGELVANDYQDDYVRALMFDLVESEDRPRAAARLVELVKKADFHLGTGFLSTGLLLPALAQNGYPEVASKLLFQTSAPSWFHSLDQNATTTWETWDGYDSNGNARMSHNHYALGAAAQWLYEGILGLRPLEPGYRRVQIAPYIIPQLSYASGSLMTPFGQTNVSWSVDSQRQTVQLQLTIPPGTLADVHLGKSRTEQVGSGSYHYEYSLQSD